VSSTAPPQRSSRPPSLLPLLAGSNRRGGCARDARGCWERPSRFFSLPSSRASICATGTATLLETV
jgi:hypothetical protein